MKYKIMVCLLLIIIVGCFFVPIKNLNAEDNNYSIDYLLRHYHVVTFGTKDNNILNEYKRTIQGTNKGDIKNLNVEGPVLARGEYANKVNENVDFDKMFIQVMNESQELVDDTQYHINDSFINIDKPGIYLINNTIKRKSLYYSVFRTEEQNYDDCSELLINNININNYNPNKLYIFNILDSMPINNYSITITENGAPSSINFNDFVESGKYTGNIIFNYPKAKYLELNNINGTIIAPQADVYLNTEYMYYFDYNGNNYVPKQEIFLIGNIYSNSITNVGSLPLKYVSYGQEDKISGTNCNYINDSKDYTDDIYSGDYSLSTLLQNYNIVSLGKNDYQPNSKNAFLGYPRGGVGLFHIAGAFLINGNIGTMYSNYPGHFETCGNCIVYNSAIRMDLESNYINESYVGGLLNSRYNVESYYTKQWMTGSEIRGTKNYLYKKANSYYEHYQYFNHDDGVYDIPDNFINFNRLYDNIVAEQKGIEEGEIVKSKEGVAHIPIGGNYVIDDISNINEIVFDNFAENKNVITIVTIKNSGSINFPLISKDTGEYKGIITNDYYGKKIPTQGYEMGSFNGKDEYHGNIVFNVPNANYIKLAPNAPFAGHLIAPNADVETEETQLAGCMIVNSLFAEGGSEAHFYPLTVYDNCECSVEEQVPKHLQARFNEMRLSKLLGGNKSIVESTILGDQVQFKKDTDQLNGIINNCPLKHNSSPIDKIANIIKNPPTLSTIGIIISILVALGISMIVYNKKKNNNTN